MAGSRDNDGCVDGVGVHAGVVIVMEGDEGPVRCDLLALPSKLQGEQKSLTNDTGNTNTILGRTCDEVLNTSGIKELDVGELEDLRKDSRGEKSGMLDNDIVAFIIVRYADLTEESISRLAHDHGRKELAAEPSTSTLKMLVQ